MPARANSGPPPDPNALRRDRPNDQATWVTLPAEGRDAPAPDWPLSRPTARERHFWEDAWRRPQAGMWDAERQHQLVALYCRALAVAEQPKGTVQQRTLVKQLAEELGISLTGMARRRWRIAVTEPARPVVRTDDPDRDKRKAALKALIGGAA